MFGKILGRKKDDLSEMQQINPELLSKIANMNLTEMRAYVNSKLSGFEVSDVGLVEILKKLIVADEKTAKTYVLIDDMDSKKKKAFDIVLLIAKSTSINVDVVDKVQEFVLVYKDLITKYDTDNKEIYASRFKDAISQMIESINHLASLQKKMKVLG